VLEPEMLTTKRPGNGIPALRLAELVGRRAARTLEADHQLEEADVV
jgi:sialic acid synthase SpsE